MRTGRLVRSAGRRLGGFWAAQGPQHFRLTKYRGVDIVASDNMKQPDPALQRQGEAFHEALSDFVRAYLVGERDRICCHDISLTQCYAIEALLRRGH